MPQMGMRLGGLWVRCPIDATIDATIDADAAAIDAGATIVALCPTALSVIVQVARRHGLDVIVAGTRSRERVQGGAERGGRGVVSVGVVKLLAAAV